MGKYDRSLKLTINNWKIIWWMSSESFGFAGGQHGVPWSLDCQEVAMENFGWLSSSWQVQWHLNWDLRLL